MPTAGFEPTILASERPQTHASDHWVRHSSDLAQETMARMEYALSQLTLT